MDAPAMLRYTLTESGQVVHCEVDDGGGNSSSSSTNGATTPGTAPLLRAGAMFWENVHSLDVQAVVGWLAQLQAAPRDAVHAVYRRTTPDGHWTWCQTVLFAQLIPLHRDNAASSGHDGGGSSSNSSNSGGGAGGGGGYGVHRRPSDEPTEAIHAIVAHETVMHELDRMERITAERARLRDLLEHQVDSIYRLDEAGRFTFVNGPACAAWGYTVHELIGQPCFAMVAIGDRAASEEMFRWCLLHGQPPTAFVLRRRCSDGTYIAEETQFTPVVGSERAVQVIARQVPMPPPSPTHTHGGASSSPPAYSTLADTTGDRDWGKSMAPSLLHPPLQPASSGAASGRQRSSAGAPQPRPSRARGAGAGRGAAPSAGRRNDDSASALRNSRSLSFESATAVKSLLAFASHDDGSGDEAPPPTATSDGAHGSGLAGGFLGGGINGGLNGGGGLGGGGLGGGLGGPMATLKWSNGFTPTPKAAAPPSYKPYAPQQHHQPHASYPLQRQQQQQQQLASHHHQQPMATVIPLWHSVDPLLLPGSFSVRDHDQFDPGMLFPMPAPAPLARAGTPLGSPPPWTPSTTFMLLGTDMHLAPATIRTPPPPPLPALSLPGVAVTLEAAAGATGSSGGSGTPTAAGRTGPAAPPPPKASTSGRGRTSSGGSRASTGAPAPAKVAASNSDTAPSAAMAVDRAPAAGSAIAAGTGVAAAAAAVPDAGAALGSVPPLAATTATATAPATTAAAAAAAAASNAARRRVRSNATRTACLLCHTEKSLEWRRGPDGNSSLCNACGLRFARLQRHQTRASALATVPAAELTTAVVVAAAAATATATATVAAPDPSSAMVTASPAEPEQMPASLGGPTAMETSAEAISSAS